MKRFFIIVTYTDHQNVTHTGTHILSAADSFEADEIIRDCYYGTNSFYNVTFNRREIYA